MIAADGQAGKGQVAADGDGLSVSKRRITLSTSGVVPMIPELGERLLKTKPQRSSPARASRRRAAA